MKTLILAILVISFLLGLLETMQDYIISFVNMNPYELIAYYSLLRLTYVLVGLVISFPVFYYIGKNIELRKKLASIIIYLAVLIYLGELLGSLILSLYFGNLMLLIYPYIISIYPIQEFFIAFTGLSMGYLRASNKE